MPAKNRRDSILKHIGRYVVTVRPVLDKLFFDGTPDGCKNDLAELKTLHLIHTKPGVVPDGHGKKLAYYWLSKPGTQLADVISSKSSPPTPAALDRNLALLWFCCMDKQRRYRLEREDLVDLFGEEAVTATDGKGSRVGGFHCLERHDDSNHCVYQVYRTTAPRDQCMREIKQRLRNALASRITRRWVTAQQYGFAILTETPSKTLELEDAIKQQKFGDYRFVVTCAPGPWK
jgi:hypothetical protein